MDIAKPFCIAKRDVWEAYKRVKANRGAAGVDGESIAAFEKDLANNLYRIWNRMSSGSYFPPAVRRVDIPKDGGKTRPLGIPTVSDRIAQTVVQRYLEPILEPVFHADSYGYRPGRSAHDALAVARQRCWRHDWVLDLDIRSFFDEIDWELLMRAVRHHTDCAWVLLYIERWLHAPVYMPDGTVVNREKGTPQGSVVSPILANLFLHYTFDMWMQRQFPALPFERYADDAIIHCDSEEQARQLLDTLKERFAECKLALHPQKDQDRVLQGCQPAPSFSGTELRLPRLYLSAARGDERFRKDVCQFHPGSQREGNAVDAVGSASVEVVASRRSCLGSDCAVASANSPRLDQLLRSLLSVGPVSGLTRGGRVCHSLGATQVQMAQEAFHASVGLAEGA